MPTFENKTPEEVKENWLYNLLSGGPEEASGLAGPMPLISKLKAFRKFGPETKRHLASGFRKIPQIIFDVVKDIQVKPSYEMSTSPAAGGSYNWTGKGKGIGKNVIEIRQSNVDPFPINAEEQAATVFHELGHAAQHLHLPFKEWNTRGRVLENTADLFSNNFFPQGKKYNAYLNGPTRSPTSTEEYLKSISMLSDLLQSMGPK